MHSKVLSLFLALTVTLPLILLVSPAPVYAVSISVVPTSGTVSTSIQISGNGFSGRLATIHWDDQIALSKIPISETGELTCNLKVPPASRGDHIIKITDDSNWTASTASTTFTVFPGITTPPPVGQNASVTVIGNGFAASEKGIRVTWDGSVLPTSATANNLGTWSINFKIPETNRGEHFIGAFSNSTAASEIGEHRIIVAPFAKVKPTSGPVGTEITIDGFGFRTGEDGITITWDGEIILCNLVGGTDGSWSTTLNIPPCTKGYHTIGVYGSSFTPKGIVPDTDFNVVTHIGLQPTSGNKGTKVTVNGAGFASDEAITLNFEDKSLNVKAIADNAGSFSAAFEVPQSTVKNNRVQAMGSAGNSAEAMFITEKIAPLTPTLLSPQQGAKLEVFNSVGDVFLVPAKSLIGIITFKDYRQQGFGSPISTFDWSDVNAAGKASYTLQISRGDDFSSQVLLKENLLDSEYTLSQNDISTKGLYSWRVKAVDDIGNESQWSDVRKFDLILMSNQALILSITIPILVIAAILAAGMLAWRKHKTIR
ncbi:MAG: IPT/TIG domain-containing protein [Dehalococcoidia bacterium]